MSRPIFYMRVPLPDGSMTDGKVDYSHYPDALGLASLDLSGKRVLDVAANDGFWTFWAEDQGAGELIGTDVDSFERYDWGWGQPDEKTRAAFSLNPYAQWAEAGAGFRWIAEQRNSRAQRRDVSVYDLEREGLTGFDIVFCFGLLYHLRHPLLALDTLRRACSGVLVLETFVFNCDEDHPRTYFYWDNAMRSPTNWTGPTKACVASWLRSAGFPHIWATTPNVSVKTGRTVFVAAIDETERAAFDSAPRLTYLDDAYWRRVHEIVRQSHGVSSTWPVGSLEPPRSR